MEKIPDWVEIGEGARIHPTVLFAPWNGKKTIIGKRVSIESGTVIYGGVSVGNDSGIGHNTVIRFNTEIGVHSVIANLCMLDGNIVIGNHTMINSHNHIAQKTTIGSYVFMAPMCVTTNDPEISFYRKEYSQETWAHWKFLEGPTIKDGVRIGASVVILPKVIIGKQAFIGAGAVVTKSVPEYAVVFGAPARIIRYIKPDADQIVLCKREHF